MSLKDLVMAIVSKPYQAFPLFAPGLVNCGCSGVDPCLHFLTTDTMSFQVGLTPSHGCLCGFDCDFIIEGGDMSPIATGNNTTSGGTLTDATKEFTTLGVQAGGACGYIVKNTTLNTYTYVTVVINASTLSLNAGIFTAAGQAYAIFPFNADDWRFSDGTASNSLSTEALRSCSPCAYVDNRYTIVSVDIIETLAEVMVVRLGGQEITYNTAPSVIDTGTHLFAFAPGFFSNAQAEIEFGSPTEIDNWTACVYSTIGIRIYNCDGVEVLEDSTNSHGWVTYSTGHIESPRAQVDIIWSETGLEDGCYQVCLYDLCGDTDGCILESYSVKITSTGYNYNYNEDSDACELKIEWTNYDDFEIEQGDFLNYPEYPGVAGYQSYVQLLRTFGKVRFTGFVTDDHTLNQESDGLREVVHFEGHETYELQIESLPEPLHRALAKGLAHDSFVVDGVQYVWADGEYQPAWKKSTDSASVVVRLIKQYSKGENINAAD